MAKKKLNPKNKGGPKPDVLNPQQRLFVEEYAKDMNASQAAIRAGYSKHTSTIAANRLMKKPHVKAAIERVIQRKVDKAELSADRVLEELRRVLFADMADFYDEAGNLIPMHKLSREARSALAGVETVVTNVSAGDGHVDYVHKIKLLDRTKAMELALKYHGLLKENHQHTVTLLELDADAVAAMSDEQLEMFHAVALMLHNMKKKS